MRSLEAEAAALVAAEMDKAEARESKTTASGKGSTEKKRKGLAKASTGVEKLKKANTKGMAKLSTFFQLDQKTK